MVNILICNLDKIEWSMVSLNPHLIVIENIIYNKNPLKFDNINKYIEKECKSGKLISKDMIKIKIYIQLDDM